MSRKALIDVKIAGFASSRLSKQQLSKADSKPTVAHSSDLAADCDVGHVHEHGLRRVQISGISHMYYYRL
jgi:hypothetical protein